MCGTETRNELPLASSASGCGCCSTEAPADPVTNAADAGYALEGLTCGHCVETVRKAVTALDGVDNASIDLAPGWPLAPGCFRIRR